MLDRASLTIPAMLAHPRTQAGSIKWSNPPLPKVGNHPSMAPNKSIPIMATQKLGAAIPITANNFPKWSNIVSRLTADNIPIGTPTIMERTKADQASSKVAGSR